MAQLLNEIQWSDPLLPHVADPLWEAEAKRRAGHVGEVESRTASSHWLRESCLTAKIYRVSQIPVRLANIGAVVTSQENSCRYCYGANRAVMKTLGYSETFINRIERETQVAELDVKERNFVLFCRNLARSMPRPAKAERETLIRLGFSPLAVSEMAFYIALVCFYNRVATLLACPSELALERFANSTKGRLIGLVGRLWRTLASTMRDSSEVPVADVVAPPHGPFAAIAATLTGLPAAFWMQTALEGAFASGVLPRRIKLLMFAVVARSLVCRYCETEACRMLASDGFAEPEIETALSTLASKRLEPYESKLLSWVRGTVHYQPAAIQKETQALAAEIGEAAVLEAIGIAALANMTVRLAMLLE